MSAWLGLIGAAVGIVVFFGSVVVFIRGSADKGTIDTFKRSNEALIQRVDVLEKAAVVDAAERAKERAAAQTEIARLAARVSSLERENTSLLAQRPSAEVLSKVHADLTGLITSQGIHNGEVKTILTAVASLLRDTE